MNQWTKYPVSVSERFWRKVAPTDSNGCRVWVGSKTTDGYGGIVIDGKLKRAHRVAWLVSYGEWPPEDRVVCHSCDRPLCVEIEHLWIGTPQENTADRHTKGRSASGEKSGQRTKPWRTARGESQGSAKLTNQDIIAIRSAYASGVLQRELAQRYGVGQTQISRIVRAKSWKHL